MNKHYFCLFNKKKNVSLNEHERQFNQIQPWDIAIGSGLY
jgi:hypothetical protein